ncbi:hypothetical protein [Halobacillus halophilus]|uniref:hypothetical protein n=1 Tax=Halobacillus halophilus TaxID=1570 RepID=UPI000303CF42|nr:hypothetical protein [Halobacillus halophilus]
MKKDSKEINPSVPPRCGTGISEPEKIIKERGVISVCVSNESMGDYGSKYDGNSFSILTNQVTQ